MIHQNILIQKIVLSQNLFDKLFKKYPEITFLL